MPTRWPSCATRPELLQVRTELRHLWRRSARSRRWRDWWQSSPGQVDPDEALLAGLLHNVGGAGAAGAAGAGPAGAGRPAGPRGTADRLARAYRSGAVARLAPAQSVCNAIAEQDTLEATRGGHANLNDVLAVAVIGAGAEQDLGQVAKGILRPSAAWD